VSRRPGGIEGVGPHEGLALDRAERPGPVVVLEPVPGGVAGGDDGLARRLNPRAVYLAMRWDYARWPKLFSANAVVKLTNPANGLYVFARPVDSAGRRLGDLWAADAGHGAHRGFVAGGGDGAGVAVTMRWGV